MDKELTALRRVAKAARVYQEKVIQKRTMQYRRELDQKEFSGSVFEIGSAEYELSAALNEWYRTLQKSS